MTWICSITRHLGEEKCITMCLSEYVTETYHLVDIGLHRMITYHLVDIGLHRMITYHLVDIGLHRMIILERILQNFSAEAWTGLKGISVVSNIGLLRER